jgi:hypothetical protein
VGRFGSEVRGFAIDPQSHDTSPLLAGYGKSRSIGRDIG